MRTHKEKREGAGPGVAADHRANVVDEETMGAGRPLYNIPQLFGFFLTVAVADKDHLVGDVGVGDFLPFWRPAPRWRPGGRGSCSSK